MERKLNDLEKRLERLESQLGSVDYEKLEQIHKSFMTFREIIVKMNKENIELKSDRDFLINKYTELIQKIPVGGKLAKDVNSKLVIPAKNKLVQEVKEDIELIRKVTVDGLTENIEKNDMEEIGNEQNTTVSKLDKLFEIVMKNGSVNIRDVARKFNVHQYQIEEWGKTLEKHGLVELHPGEIRKIYYKK